MAFNLTAQLNIALNSASLRNASNQLNSALNTNTQIKLGIDRNSSSGLNQIKSQISEATDSMENFGRQAGFAAKRFAAFAVTAGSIIAFTNTMKEAVSAAVDFDREMVRLRQVSSDTVQDVGAVGDQVTNLSKNLGVSSKDLIGVAVVLKQANLTLSETKDALEAMAQAALAPNFDNLKDTTEGAIAIMKQFKVEAKDLGAALGSVNAVAGEFAVEASDIIEAIRKTGGAFKAAGGQLNELIALFTSVRQTTRESAESIGTGLRTIFTRIQRNDTANALKEVGINLRYTAEEARALGDAGLEQQFVGPYEAVKRLSAGLSELRSTDPRFSAIVEQLGGYRQISKVIPLIQEFATAQKALGIAQAGSVSLAVNAGQAQDALAVKLQKLKESFFEVGRSIVNSPGFRSLADTFIGAATSVLSLINSLKGLLPLFTALAAVKIGQGIGSFATGFVKGAGADSSSVRTTRKADGGFLKMRTGGIVPGSGTGDKVPALLEPGELVVPRNQVVRQKFNQINQPAEAGEVKQKKIYNKYGSNTRGTNFTHLDIGNKPIGVSKYDKLYSNFGLDLPANWNTDWSLPENNVGVSKQRFKNYIDNHDVFATYKGLNLNKPKDKKNRNLRLYKINSDIQKKFQKENFEKRAKLKLTQALENSGQEFYDIDPEVQATLKGAMIQIKNMDKSGALSGLGENVAGSVTKISGKTGKKYTARQPILDEEILSRPMNNEEWLIGAQRKKQERIDAAKEKRIKKALGGPIPRQRFMNGKEVKPESEFLKNTFRPGYPALKDALKESGSLRYLRPIQSFAGRKGAFTLPFEILASSNDKDFWAETEGNLGKRKTDQFRRFYETKKLIEIEQKKYGDERRAKNPLALPEANPKYSEALQASIQKQEESQNRRIAKSFYAYKEDYDKNNTGSTQERKEREIYVSKTMGSFSPSTGVSRVFRKPENFDPKEERDTLKHERIHAIQKDSLRSDSPLKNSFFNTAGQQSESSLTPGKQTFLAEVQANYGAKSKPSDKRKAALEFAASKYDATSYASQYHMDIANRIGMPKFDRSVIRAERHRKNIYREGFDNPEVIAANKALGEIIDKQPKTRKNKEKNKDWMEKLEEAQRILEEARTNARGPNWQKRLDAATEISRNKDSEQMSRQIALSAELYQKLAFGGSVNRQRFMEGKYVGPKPLHPDLSAQEILGMAKGYKPNEQEVKKGFGRASLIHHPDRGGSNYNMGRVNSSYNYLKGGSITDWEKSVKAARTSYVDELRGRGEDKEAADFESTIPVRGKNKAKDQQSTKTTGSTPKAEPKQDPNFNDYADESFAQMNARTGNSSSKARREWQFATPDAFTTPNRFDSFEAVRNASQFREKEEKTKTINASSAYSDRLKASKAKRGGYFEGGPIIRMKKGGIVPGSGSGDKVRALLEPGELVVPKHQVSRQKFGEGGGPKRLTVGDKSVLLGASLGVVGSIVPFAASLLGMESIIGEDASNIAGLTYATLAAATAVGSGLTIGGLGNLAGKKIFSSPKQIEEKKQAKKLEAESKIRKQYEKRNIADRSSILLPSGGEEGSNIPKSFVTTKELSRSRSPDSGRTLTGLDYNETYDARKSIEAKEERRKKKFAEKYLGIKKEKGIFGGIRDKLSKLNPLNLLKPNLKKDPKTGKLISDTKEFQEFQYERQVKRGNREYQNRLGYALGERKDEPTAKPVVSAPVPKPTATATAPIPTAKPVVSAPTAKPVVSAPVPKPTATATAPIPTAKPKPTAKPVVKPKNLEEFTNALSPKQLADFKEKIKTAKEIIVNARTSGSMKLKSVGFNFLGTKFNVTANKDLADKGTTKPTEVKPTYDLKGVKSLDDLLSKLPPKHSEDLRAKIGRAQDKFLGTKNIKDLKFAYDFGDKRGPLNIQLEKDVIKFGSIASFPWKPKTRKEKRTEELRIATERNARKKAENMAKTAEAERARKIISSRESEKAAAKSENASSLSSIISGIDEENQQNKTYGIARDTKVFEGSDQYKELQKKLALAREERAQQSRRDLVGSTNYNVGDINKGLSPSVYNLGYQRRDVASLAKNQIEGKLSDLRESEFSEPKKEARTPFQERLFKRSQDRPIGVNDEYKAPQAQQQVDAPRFKFFSDIPGTSPQAQRLRMQREERDFNENLNIKIARSQKTKKEPRTPKTESERYNISRKQSAPIQEKTLFDESELSKIGTYQTQEQKLKDQEQKFKDNADKIKRFRDAASESARVKFKLNSRQRRRAIANENLAENLKTLRFASGGLVPGTGNSDTVPMDLPEGSFVIRKSSVNKIGADNLAKASRFASGGVVPALLTPGEYVYSPQEASKIGSSKLHAMNKFAKFARGGPIGLGRSGKFDPNNPDDIKKLKETLEEQLRYEDPNKNESLVQIEVKQNTDEVQKRAQQYTSDENARQQAETTVNSRNALVARQSGRVAVSQQNVNAAAGNVASATTARDSYISEANTQRGLVSSSRQEATRQQARITSLTAGGASATDPRLIAANTALIAATTAEATARNLQARATRNAISANNQVVANTNTLNGLLVTHGQEVRNLTRAENAAATAVQSLESATIKAEGSAQLLDEYQQDAAGKILLAGKVIGETKPLSGRGSMENVLKRKEADYEKQTGRKAGKNERETLKGDALSEYRAAAEKQLRAKSVKSGKPISELNLQATADQYTREFSEGKRKAIFNKQGEVTGDKSLGRDISSKAERKSLFGPDYTKEGDLTSKGKVKDFASRAIFGAKRTDFEAGSEGDQQFKQSRGSSVANKLTAAAVGASFLSERIKTSGGTAAGIVSKGEGDTVKVDEGAASSFKSAQAFGAALSSASTYAAVAGQSLAKFGPLVAGVGAGFAGIVGAIEGYHNGIKQAEAEIRDAKIAQALNNLQNIFERVSSGLLEVSDSTLQKISENQKVVSQENATKAYEESGGNASTFMKGLNIASFGLLGNDVNQKKYNESLSKSSKETNAAQIGPLTNVLNKYSEQIGKDAALKIKSGGGDISTTNFEDLKGGLLKDLRSAGGGAGAEQIAKIASGQDISIADAEKQFIKTLQESFQAEKIRSITTKSVQENAKAINSMQSLSNAVNAAAASADSFSSKLDTNSSLFEGSIGSTKLTSFAEKSGGSTPDFAKFNTAITESAGLLGAYGQEFKSQGNAVNAASQILPDILSQSVANPISGKETATQITDALKEGLKARGITGSAADQVVSSVGGKVSSEDFTKLLAEAGGDVSKATQKLMSDIRDPLISAFTEIDNKLTEAGNKYISGLEDLAKRQKAIGDQIGKLSELRSKSRSFAANEIQRLPGVQQGVAESINLQGARNDFSEQQQRLTGFGAGAAENPAAIASRLKNTQQQIRVQEEKVLNTNKSTNGGAEFRNAALELTKLKSQASNLNDALKNLTDQSKKLEAAQAKLAQVRQNIDEKRSLGRKLLTQGPEEQQKMLQGQAIFNQVQARGGSLQGMSTEQNAILFDFLDNFGAAGKKIQDQILDANGYGAGKDDKAEEKALVAEQARIFAQQEEAQRQIIANQQSLQQDYFSNLDSRNEKFYSELQKFTQEMQKNSLIAEKGKEQQKVAQIKDVQKEGKFLGESGFNTKEDFQKLNTYKQQVTDLAKNKKEQNRLAEANSKPISTRIKTDMNNVITNASNVEEDLVKQGGYKASEATKIREITQEKLSQGNNASDSLRLAKEQFNQQRGDELNAQQTKIQGDFKASGIEEKLNSLAQKLAGNEISFDQFDRALASVKELQLGVGEGLSTAAIGAEARIKALNEAINGLGGIQQLPNAEVKPQVSAFAVGGSVFKSRGTDTVPAMLTPGEFVVNRSATQQNLPLLQSINSGKTSYLSGGGKVGYYEDGATPVVGDNQNRSFNTNQEFIESDEYKKAIKAKYLQVSSFSGDLESKAFKLQKDKTNNDYLKESNVFFGTFRGLTSTINKAIANSDEKANISKLYSANFTTSANDFIKKRKDIKELGVYGLSNENSLLDYLHGQATNDKLARDNGIDSFKTEKETLKNKIAARKSVKNALGNGILALAGGISNLTPTYSEFDEFFPTTKLAKKQKQVEDSSEDYVGFALGIKQKGTMDYTEDVANARKQFDKRKAEERQKIIDEQQKLKNEKEAQFKIDTAAKLDTSNVLDKQAVIAKTKDIEKQKAKLKGSGIQGDYVNSGLISEVGAQNVDKFIKEKGAKEDNYFFRRKGSPEAIAKIYLQREAQAQAIIGKMKLIQDDPNINLEKIDPKVSFATGQQELQKLINGEETTIDKKSLSNISAGQKKIVDSFITMNSFESAATSKGPEMASYIETYGKAITKDPQVLVEKLIKAKAKRSDISGDPEFITAQAQGIFEALMFLDREGKANKLFASTNQIKKGRGFLEVLEEKSQKNIKSFTRFGKLTNNGIAENGIGNVNFGKKEDTEVDFSGTNFRTAVPQMDNEQIIEVLMAKGLYPYKSGLDNNVLKALDATASISNYGYLNFPANKEDVVQGLMDGGLFRVNSFPKQDDEGKTIFERQATIALLENKNTYQQLAEISKQIKGDVQESNKKAEPQPNNASQPNVAGPSTKEQQLNALDNYNAGEAYRNGEITQERALEIVRQQQKNKTLPRGTPQFRESTLPSNRRNLSSGGMVNYLATGGNVPSYRANPDPSFFKPKGTDTVPAMLSPGEFVINASATAKHGDLLSAINSGQDVGYSATGGLIEYLAYGDNATSFKKRLKNAGISQKGMMEAIQSGDKQQIYEMNLKAGDAQRSSRNEALSKNLEKQLGFNFFKGPDANKKAGVSRVGDAGNYAEGPQELGSYAIETKPIQLAKEQEQKQEQQQQKQTRTMPLLPPTQPTTTPPDVKDKKPDNTNAVVKTDPKQSIGEIEQLKAKMEALQAQQDAMANEELYFSSKGGIPSSSSDTIPAMLTPGEFVVNARQSSKNASLLHAINTGKDVEGFANGGTVGYYAGGKTGGGGKTSGLLLQAAITFNNGTSRFDAAISRMNRPDGGSNNNNQINIAKSSFEELSRILKTEIKIGSGPIDKFNNAVTQFGTNSTGFNSGFSSSLEKFKTYADELNAAISRIPGTLNLQIIGNLNASLNVSFDVNSVYMAVTDATTSLKGWITSEISRQITDEMA